MLAHLLFQFLDVSLQESIVCRGANPPNVSARAVDFSPQLTVTFVPLQSLPGRTPRGQRFAELSLGLGVSTPTTSRHRAFLPRDERLSNLQSGHGKRGLHLVHAVAPRGIARSGLPLLSLLPPEDESPWSVFSDLGAASFSS